MQVDHFAVGTAQHRKKENLKCFNISEAASSTLSKSLETK